MSFSGPTPPNTMTESKQGYGYAECSRCGFRTQISEKMTAEDEPELYSRSKDQVLLHNCDEEQYNWPKEARERSKLRISILTAISEIERWQGVLENCLHYFSPDTRNAAEELITQAGQPLVNRKFEMIELIESQPGSFL